MNARRAAEYVGYEPTAEHSRDDRQMRAFYEWVRRHNVSKHRRGSALLFRRVDLDRAIALATHAPKPDATDIEQLEALARQHAAGGIQ